jgi:hypothetical protein
MRLPALFTLAGIVERALGIDQAECIDATIQLPNAFNHVNRDLNRR